MRAFATVLLLLTSSGALAQTTLYASDFEADDGGWSGTGDWEWGAPSPSPDETACTTPGDLIFPSGAASGTNVWGTNLDGCHAASEDARLTQSFDFSTAGDMPQICWMQFVESGANAFDMASLEVNGTQVYLSTGTSAGMYEPQCVDLAAYAGQASVEIAFRFVTSTVVERAGWYVDDVAITTMGAVSSEAAPQVGFVLSPVRPNPLRGHGRLSLSVDQTQTVVVDVVNALGQRVATVFEGVAAAGAEARLEVDARGLAAGVYLVRVTGETVHGSVRMTVQR